MTQVVVQLHDVSFRYTGVQEYALKDFSLTVNPSETIALAGPSPTGKSTALGIIAGELPLFWGGDLAGTVFWTERLRKPHEAQGPNVTLIGALLHAPREHLTGFLSTVYEELTFDLRARS